MKSENKVTNPGEKEEKISQPVAGKSGNETTIENHRQAAAHHTAAAKHNEDAAKHYEAGNHEKAAHSAMQANGHHAIAGEFLSDDAKHHAQLLKRTITHKGKG